MDAMRAETVRIDGADGDAVEAYLSLNRSSAARWEGWW